MPRLGHKKSRNGCRQCKRRHVKVCRCVGPRPFGAENSRVDDAPRQCDEKKPCSNCARHGVECSLVTWAPNTTSSTPLAQVVPIKREPSASASSSAPDPIPKRQKKACELDPLLCWREPCSSASQLSTATSRLPIDYVLNPTPSTPANSEGSSPYSQSDTYPFLAKFAHKTDTVQSDYWVRDLELMCFPPPARPVHH